MAMGSDTKFFRKAAEKVWNTRPDLFNPSKEIPDSLKEKFSAVVIGQYDFIDADYQQFDDFRGSESRAERTFFTRKMVKLLDKKAVEDFSKHEFGMSSRVGVRLRKNLAESDHAFGARIHKPDGSVVDVDISKAYSISEGKDADKDKALKRIIDIPGLEPGDVLEYFTLTEEKIRELDFPALRVALSDDYPVLESVLEGSFHPKLTVEFRGYNGAPEVECSINDKGKNTVWLKIENLPVITDKNYVNRIREVPFYDFYVLNNTSAHRFYPKYARKGGLYQNPLPGTIFRDISLVMAASDYDSSTFPGKVRKVIANYRKEYPDASVQELLDMAWTAANYVNAVETSVSDYWLALIFCDIIRKEKLGDTVGVAFINPSTDVPTEEIANWRQPDFGALVGDKLYLNTSLNAFISGELPPIYQGQMCASYPGDREKLWNFTMPTIVTTPLSKSGDNKFVMTSTITLGEDNDAISSNEITLSGGMKYLASAFNNDEEWISQQEEFLGISPNKRNKAKSTDSEERAKEIKIALEEIYKDIYTGDNAEVSDISIINRGVTPANPEFKITFDSKMPEVYTVAGNDMLVKIGNFAGRHNRIEGAERDHHDSNISFLMASQDNLNIILNIPEGYEVDDNSLSSLSNNVQTPVGMFVTAAKKSTDGKSVSLAVRSRINAPVVNPTAWKDVLALSDAKSAFSDAMIVLKKKD